MSFHIPIKQFSTPLRKACVRGAALCVAVLCLSSCSVQGSADAPGARAHLQTADPTAEVSTAKVYPRTASTVKRDGKTGSVITAQESFQLSTYITVSIYDAKEVPERVFDHIFSEIHRYEQMLSRTIATSDVSKINASAGKGAESVSSDVIDMLMTAAHYSEASSGLFDASVGVLVDLWGIGTDAAHVPTDADIEAARAHVDYRQIEINPTEQTVYVKDPEMKIDLGAIAKGYIADRIKAVILEEGYAHAIINLGGNVLTVGTKPNSETWSIGVRDPNGDAGQTMGILHLKDTSVVSSGVYERYFIQDDVRYHHILNPFTGRPADNSLVSVSIISERSVDGDALSTTVFLMGLDAGRAYVDTLADVEAVFITKDGSVYLTSGIRSGFVLTDKRYTLKD